MGIGKPSGARGKWPKKTLKKRTRVGFFEKKKDFYVELCTEK